MLYNVPNIYTFDFIEKEELVDIKVLDKITNNENLVKHYDYKNGEKCFFRPDNMTLLVLLKKYQSRYADNAVKTCYFQNEHKTGRFYVEEALGLQSIEKHIRHTISGKYYHDLDIKNCHPVLAEQICKKNGWTCTALEFYNNNRNYCLDLLSKILRIPLEDAKKIVLVILNGGRPRLNLRPILLKNELRWFVDLSKQVYVIHKLIFLNYPKYRNIVLNKRKLKNKEGSAFNHFMLDLENQCLLCFHEYLINRGYKPDVLCFDGLMVRKKNLDDIAFDKNILYNAELYIYDKLKFKVNIVEKPMDLKIICNVDLIT